MLKCFELYFWFLSRNSLTGYNINRRIIRNCGSQHLPIHGSLQNLRIFRWPDTVLHAAQQKIQRWRLK